MGVRETFKEAAGSVRTSAEDTKNGVMILTAVSVLSLGVLVLVLLADRQILKAVRASGHS